MTLDGLGSPIQKRTAKDMMVLLEGHYAPPPSKPAGGRLISEIQAPNSTRRADALYLPITTAGRGSIIGHEIKVSRSDVLAEIGDPHKADAWMRYCDRWWLVVSDAALIEGLDIPPQWGVMAPPTRGRFMTIVTKAPVLTPDPSHLAEAWGTIFARVGYADLAAQNELIRLRKQTQEFSDAAREQHREIARLNAALGEDGMNSAFRANRLSVANVLAEIDRLGEYDDKSPKAFRGAAWSLDAEAVARGILAAAVLKGDRRHVTDDIVSAISRANTAAQRLTEVLDELRDLS